MTTRNRTTAGPVTALRASTLLAIPGPQGPPGAGGGGSATYGRDLAGPDGSQTVIGIQGLPVLAGTPGADGYVLTWVLANSRYEWKAPNAAITFGTDLTGNSTNQTVVGLKGSALPALSAGYLHYTGSAWALTALPTALPPNGAASGDLGSTYPAPTVVGLRGAALPSLSAGYLNYNGSSWVLTALPSSVPPRGSAGGDLAGTYPNPTLAKIQGVTLPAPSGSNTVLKYDGANLSWALTKGGLGPNTAWSTAHWYIDPVSGNDTNAGTSSGTALKTFKRLAQLWDTYMPVLNSSVTVTFLSSQSDTTDRVFLDPLMVEGGQLYLEGTPILLATGTFSAFTPRSTSAADGRIRVNLGTGGIGHTGTRGLLLVNTSRSNSVATIHQVISGTVLAINQPYAAASLTSPALPADPVEHNDWANGDGWALYQLPTVYVAQLQSVIAGATTSNYSFAFMQHIYVPDPTGTPGNSSIDLSRSVVCLDSVIDAFIEFTPNSGIGNAINFINCDLAGGGIFYGAGITGGSALGLTLYDQCSVGGDIVITSYCEVFGQGHTFGAICSMAGNAFSISGSAASSVQGAWDRTEIYGTYNFAVGGGPTYGNGFPIFAGEYTYHTSAISNFKGVATFALDNLQVAIAEDYSVSPVQTYPYRGMNVATLDSGATTGGFSSLARGYGGSVLMSDAIVPVSPSAYKPVGPSNWNDDSDLTINDSFAIHNLGSASIVAPRAGYVLVTACFHWNNLASSSYSAIYGIGTTSSAYIQEYAVIIPQAVSVSDAANRSSFDGSLTYRLAVSPGTTTIYTLASQVSGTDANVLLCGADILLQFSDT